jgi:hypothetical protein
MIRRIPRLGTRKLKNEIGHVTVDREFYIDEVIVFFKGSKRRKKPSEPKSGIKAPK